MEKFLFIPPVDESLPPLKTGQWVLLVIPFLISLALLGFLMLTAWSHIWFAWLAAVVLPMVAFPMQMYAMNRKGRLVGKLFFAAVFVIVLYYRWNWIEAHPFEVFVVALIIMSVCWITWCIDKVGNTITERLNAVQRRINSVESKLDKMERTARKEKSETEEISAE